MYCNSFFYLDVLYLDALICLDDLREEILSQCALCVFSLLASMWIRRLILEDAVPRGFPGSKNPRALFPMMLEGLEEDVCLSLSL
jgi:hypothetical protein